MPAKPVQPEPMPYDGLEHVVCPENDMYTITGTPAATDAGSYSFTATLKSGYVWGDGTSDAVTINWEITKPALVVTEFSQDGWQLGEAPKPAHLVVTAGAGGPAVTLTDTELSYQYAQAEAGPWFAALPAAIGTWYVRPVITGGANFDAPETVPTASFRIWGVEPSPVEELGYHALLSVSSYTGAAALEGFPMLVRISKNTPEGFDYDQAYPDGSDLRFFAVDNTGALVLTDGVAQPLPYEIESWNPAGETAIWVKVPRYENGPVAVMCWGPLDGKELPAQPAATEVWTGYTAVWHMEETITPSDAAATKSMDATSNHRDATPVAGANGDITQMVSTNGVVGTGRVNMIANTVPDNRGNCLNTGITSMGTVFTVSGWFHMSKATSYQRIMGNKNGTNNGGWSIEMRNNSSTAILVRGNTASVDAGDILPDLTKDWVYLTFVYNGAAVSVYANGVRVWNRTDHGGAGNTTQWLAIGSTYNNSERSFLGCYDEVRVVPRALDADWILADYRQVREGFATFGPAIVTPHCVFKNFWKVEPTYVTEWGTGETPLLDAGIPAYGAPSYYVITAVDGTAWTNDSPSVAGAYTLVFHADAGTTAPAGTWSWSALATEEILVNVTAHSPRTDLSGTAGSATLSGRVLLANNEPGTVAPILDQDYNQTAESSPAIYWEHEGDSGPAYLQNLKAGTTHRLIAGTPVEELAGATNIWELTDTFLGTIYATRGLEDEALRNCLPYSDTSADTPGAAVNIALRNVLGATVLSPCYTNGIGTIYFDAVNGWTRGAEDGYKLVVEVLTGEDALAESVSDEKWQAGAATLRPLFRDSLVGPQFTALEETQELALSVTNGNQSADSFYRIVVPLEIKGPARFRIRRTSVPVNPDGTPMFDLNFGGFILLDNIIVSYPAMRADLSSYGWYDPTKQDKQTLGYENAWNVPFPALGDELHPRAQVTFYTNPGDVNADTNAFITSARLHYRWRYLAQQMNPWATVALDPASLNAPDTLNIRNALGEVLPGDVEFWYDLRLNAPYYKFVDYAAVSGFRMSDFYSEEVGSVTNRRDAAEGALASCGTDWFVRLREGKSDYEGLDFVYFRGDAENAVTNRLAMELVGNHIWRGYLKTPTNATGTVSYRIEAMNLQEPKSTTFTNNVAYWHNGPETSGTPVSATLKGYTDKDIEQNSENEIWSGLPIDATTGYLLVQVDDATKSITIVHADYQNFKEWSDAHTSDKTFKSTSTDGSGKTGTSPRKVTYTQSFDNWSTMPATDPEHWSESFIPSATAISSLGYDLYKTYPNLVTPNNWYAGQGMYIYSNYRDEQNEATGRPGVALQMEGQGRGYVQFVDSANAPRGIESVGFTARVGQFIDFGDFSYYDAPVKMGMTNYTLCARVAYDTSKNTAFSGNASLSLVAYYRPGVGAYEFRIEQRKANRNNTTKAVTGVNRKSELLSFYKWVYNQATGKMTKTLLGSQEYTLTEIPETTSMTGSFWPVYFSVSNDVSGAAFLMAGVARTKDGLKYDAAYDSNNMAYYCVGYRDTATPLTKGGTYGLVSANCPGVFQTPFTTSTPIGFQGGTLTSDKIMKWDSKDLKFTGTRTTCLNDIFGENWVVTPGRMESYCSTTTNATNQAVSPTDNYKWGIKARAVAPQAVGVYTAPAGTGNWSLLATTNVATFGTSTKSGDTFRFNTYTTRDCSLKIAPVSSIDDVRVDIVIDDIELRQFRGADSYTLSRDYIPLEEWENNRGYDTWGKTNFLFTSAWIKSTVSGTQTNGMVLLSAKRALTNHVSSIRGPLLDGAYGRGQGLGMLSFSWRDAQENARLLVQIATNAQVGAATLANETPLWDTPDYWVTVTNVNFAAMTAADRARGIFSCYFGLHGIDGVARLVVDPDTVASVANVTDPTRFGEVWIDSILVRDEPTLDARSWTGWNLRMVGDATDSEKFMYLPDFNVGADGAEPSVGLSAALNNSVTAGVPETDRAEAKENKPYVQTPVFTDNDVGSVTFRARRYDTFSSQPAAVVLYGSRNGSPDGTWTKLGEPFVVSNNTYATYSYTTDPGEKWKAFRLAVTGVEGVASPGPVIPEEYAAPVRVLIDEVFVSEAVRPRVGFRHVGAFRGVAPASINGTTYVPDVPSEREQPLCNESFGVQCEVYAAQLPDEIDLTIEPQVRLYWFAGEDPWGFDVWKTNKLCKSAKLVKASDTNLVYRSSYYSAPDTVIPAFAAPGQVVQYALEVVYYQVGSAVPITNTLSATDWETPAWYKPVDLNAAHPEGDFSAYTILDTVAPHWSWINEVNIFGEYDENYDNSDKYYQYVEIAVPAEADITGWRVELVETGSGGSVITNTLGVFGGNLEPTKRDLIGMASNMVFRVLANQGAKTRGNLKVADGTLDAVWQVQNPTATLTPAGEISGIDPVGIRLVRASGIIEHEIVALGMDWWAQYEGFDEYSPTNTAAQLNARMPGSGFFYVGDDDGGAPTSRGVFNERGGTTNVWNNTMVRTPGRINEGQYINPDHPTPNGSSMLVYCNLDTALGHIYQTVGDAVATNGNYILVIQKGLEAGTNITYTVDPWYKLGTVTANGKVVAAQSAGKLTYTVNVAANASNNVTVVASAEVNDNLLANGLTADNRYRPAILEWLHNHKDAYGNDWSDPEAEEVKLADFISMSGNIVTNMTLTEMYWLDMDPTVGNLALKAGMAEPPGPAIVDGYAGSASVTNVKMGVFMMITNRATGAAWSPYILRGMAPDETSWGYAEPSAEWAWTSATFKVTGLLANGYTSEGNRRNWIPLRWFVFAPDSFYQPGEDGGAPFTSKIEVHDPYGPESPAGSWGEWVREHGYTPVFFSWALDERLKPADVEIQKKTNFYE